MSDGTLLHFYGAFKSGKAFLQYLTVCHWASCPSFVISKGVAIIPALLMRPWRAVSFVRKTFAAATTVRREQWSISRRVIFDLG